MHCRFDAVLGRFQDRLRVDRLLRTQLVRVLARRVAGDWLRWMVLLVSGNIFGILSDGSDEDMVGSPSLSLFRLGRWRGKRVLYAALRRSRKWWRRRWQVRFGPTITITRRWRGSRCAVKYP